MFFDTEVIFIRKDLREKYGLQPIKSYDDLKKYLDKVKENEPSMIPFALKGDRGFFKMFGPEEQMTQVRAEPYSITGTGTTFNVVLLQDGKKVLGATTLGDPAEEFTKYPAPFNKSDYTVCKILHLNDAIMNQSFAPQPYMISECLTNVARHAQAKNVWVTIRDNTDKLYIGIMDDGKGFHTDIIGKQTGHYGLLGMYERARLIGGKIQINSIIHEGTSIDIEASLAKGDTL
jgi:hypothetical protein